MRAAKVKAGGGSGLHRLAAAKAKGTIRPNPHGHRELPEKHSARGMDYGTHVQRTEMDGWVPKSALGRKRGGKLTAAERHALPKKAFALPGERYPINDASHARNALARVSQHGSSAEKAKVRAAVHRKYPGIGQK